MKFIYKAVLFTVFTLSLGTLLHLEVYADSMDYFDPGSAERPFFSSFSLIHNPDSTADVGQVDEIAYDGDGNLYVVGTSGDDGYDFDQDGLITGVELNSGPVQNHYVIAKYNQAGDALWMKDFAGDDTLVFRGVDIDSDGVLYLAFWFQDSGGSGVDYDTLNAGDTFAAPADGEIYVAKILSDGNLGWFQRIASDTSGHLDRIYGFDVGENSISVAFVVRNTVSIDFDPGAGVVTSAARTGARDIAVAQYSTNDGSYQRHIQLQAVLNDNTTYLQPDGIITDLSGNVYLVFYHFFGGEFYIDDVGGSVTHTNTAGTGYGTIVKYDSNLAYQAHYTFQTDSEIQVMSGSLMDINGSSLVLTGSAGSGRDIDTDQDSVSDLVDVSLAFFEIDTATMDLENAFGIASSDDGSLYSFVDVKAVAGDILVAGGFDGNVNFATIGMPENLIMSDINQDSDGFIASYSTTGELNWLNIYGSEGYEEIYAMDVAPDGQSVTSLLFVDEEMTIDLIEGRPGGQVTSGSYGYALVRTDLLDASISIEQLPDSLSSSDDSFDFGIVLNAPPAADVTVDLSAYIDGEDVGIVLSPSTLVFTPENWDTPQTVTVNFPDGFALESETANFEIVNAVTSSDTYYDTLNIDSQSTLIIPMSAELAESGLNIILLAAAPISATVGVVYLKKRKANK